VHSVVTRQDRRRKGMVSPPIVDYFRLYWHIFTCFLAFRPARICLVDFRYFTFSARQFGPIVAYLLAYFQPVYFRPMFAQFSLFSIFALLFCARLLSTIQLAYFPPS